jgi:Fic/DOC family
MFVDTPRGAAFVPDELRMDLMRSCPDDSFADCLRSLQALERSLARRDNEPIYYQLILQREAQAFSPRLAGEKVRDMVYVTAPFVPYHVFDSAEALSFAEAQQFAWNSSRRPFCSAAFLRAVHRRLLPGEPRAGELRRNAIWMGQRKSTIDDAVIVLTPPEYLRPMLARLADFTELPADGVRIAMSAMTHFQIISLHPFFDGNGRLVRAVTPAMLRHFGLIEEPCLGISEELSIQRWAYFERVEAAQKDGELVAWIKFFGDVLTHQARRTQAFVEVAASVREDLRSRCAPYASPRHVARFVDDVMLSPTVKRSRIRNLLALGDDATDAFTASLRGVYGFEKAVADADPTFQFGDLYDVFAR